MKSFNVIIVRVFCLLRHLFFLLHVLRVVMFYELIPWIKLTPLLPQDWINLYYNFPVGRG